MLFVIFCITVPLGFDFLRFFVFAPRLAVRIFMFALFLLLALLLVFRVEHIGNTDISSKDAEKLLEELIAGPKRNQIVRK